ncbi:glycosyltransferase [Candidatus Gottesmanbacteria bacterium]|nr:glycosyltransferase [Candidatus Gottesmanbacteria bacterium]
MNSRNIEKHFDNIAADYDYWKKKSWYYHKLIKQLFSTFVPTNQKVLEIGCGTGDVLTFLKPSLGYGVDISEKMVRIARKKYPALHFLKQGIEDLNIRQKFDYIVLADLIDHLPDIFVALLSLRKACHNNTKVIISTINPFWEPFLDLAEKLKLKMPEGEHNWVPLTSLTSLIEIADYEIIESGYRLLMPIYIPILSNVINHFFQKIPVLKNFGFVQYIIFRKIPLKKSRALNCSVIIPAFNEEDNIDPCIKRIPQIGKNMEIIVVDDGSTDSTSKIVRSIIPKEKRVKLISLSKNRGKVWAVKEGFDRAKGPVLIILDADMSVPPEELKYFYQILASGKAEFINGTRMFYPLENQSMRQLNLWGNKIFGIIFSWMMQRNISDTLCGTKALLKNDYQKISMGGDPWGDFDLLFGATKLGLSVKEFPIHYKKRVAGESKMKTINHGIILTIMCLKGLYELKIKNKYSL